MLTELYLSGPMIPAHIRKVIKDQSKYYVYRRLNMLEDLGYISHENYYEPIVGKKRKVRKVGKFYYLLSPGIKAARNHIKIDLNTRIRITKPSEDKMFAFYNIGNIYANLSPYFINGNLWFPSKLAKKTLKINKKAQILSVLKINERYHAVYHVTPKQNLLDVNVIVNIMTFSTQNKVDGHIFLCATQPQTEELREICLKNDYSFRDLRIVTYSNAVEVIQSLIENSQYDTLKNILKSKHFKELTVKNSPNILPGLQTSPPGKFIGETTRGEFFMTELITENISTLQTLRKFNAKEMRQYNFPGHVFVLVKDNYHMTEYKNLIRNMNVAYVLLKNPDTGSE